MDYNKIRAFVLDKIYDIVHTDNQGQPQTTRGKLRSLDHDGFVIVEKADGTITLIPKDRIDRMHQIPMEDIRT